MPSPPPDGYFEYSAQKQYIPDSPDTFFAQVQPPTSDSGHTPPSPAPKPRLSRNHSHGQSTTSSTTTTQPLKRNSTTSHTHGPPPQIRRERERQLANTPRDTLIQLTITNEYQAKEAKRLLTTSLMQLELMRDKLAREQEMRRTLEEEKRMEGVKTTQAIIDAQKEAMAAKEGVAVWKLQLENAQRDLQRARDVVRHVESERDEADRALVRARTTARQFKEQAVLLQAREEGRREGFEEGLRQGRAVNIVADPSQFQVVGNGTSFIEEVGAKRGVSGHKASHGAPTISLEQEAARESLEKIDAKENLRVKMQLNAVERELDTERQRWKEADRERRKLKEEKEKMQLEKERLEEEREKERRVLRELEREKEDMRRREEEERRQMMDERRRVEEEKEREVRELRRERSRLEREKKEIEHRAREERERERERLKRAEEEKAHEREREKETNATIAAAAAAAATAAVEASNSHNTSPDYQRVPYLAMPPPPSMANPSVMPGTTPSAGRTNAVAGGFAVPRAGSSGSQRAGGGGGAGGQNRRTSVDSYSSVSTMPFEMLQFPNANDTPRLSERDRDRDRERDRQGELSVIHEMDDGGSSVRGMSPAAAGTLPTWVTNPPVDYARAEMEARNGNGHGGTGPMTDGWRPGVRSGAPEWPFPSTTTTNGGPGGGIYANNSYQPNPNQNPDLLSPAYPTFASRRTSQGSIGSYEITIEPPSRSPSSIGQQEIDGTGVYLSPNQAPVPLPQTQPQQTQETILPVRPRGVPYDYDTSGLPTQPNTPVVLDGPLPPGFVPQTITDAQGISTPIWQGGSLPGLGIGGPGAMPQRPVIPPPVIPGGMGMGAAPSRAAPIYGNPLSRDRDRDREDTRSSYGVAPPPPAGFGYSPSSLNRPVIPGAPGGPPSMAAAGWGTPAQRAGSLGSGGAGMTPATSTRDLPGMGAGPRSGVSIYGPPIGGGGGVYGAPPMSMPMPGSSSNNIDDDEDDDGFDPTTTQNTKLNATIGKRTPTPMRRK